MAPEAELVTLCRLDELLEGEARGFDPLQRGRDALFIVKRGATLRAYRNRCPHEGASLPWRKNAYLNADGSRIVCGAHGALFDIDTGQCLQGPALGKTLEPMDVRLTTDGSITLRLEDLLAALL